MELKDNQVYVAKNSLYSGNKEIIHKGYFYCYNADKDSLFSDNDTISMVSKQDTIELGDYFEEWNMPMVSKDNVNHPEHYTKHPSGVECIEIARHYNFDIGNAIKYLWRAGLKKDANLNGKQKEIEDLKKAIWYIQDYIKILENETSTQ